MLMACVLTRLFRSRARLEAEILVLRQQINVLRRKSPKRPSFSNFDRLWFVWLSRLVPTTLDALTVVRPETVIGWHRAGFRAYWRWKSRPRGGRPKKPPQIRQLIRDMSIANPLWGAPRIHGELLKLGLSRCRVQSSRLQMNAVSGCNAYGGAPCVEGFAAESTLRCRADEMATDVESVIDRSMCREESLSRPG